MLKVKITLIFFIAILLITIIFSPTVSANSAEPPGLTIIASFAPDDLTLTIHFEDGSVINAVQLQKDKKAWESYYRFFYGMGEITKTPSFEGATLIAQSSEYNFECVLPASAYSQYNNLLTLNVEDQSVFEGQSATRPILLISMRVLLTLLIEGMVFFVFGYRNRASWVAFIVINLITQSALNALYSGVNLGSYWIIGYIILEIIIFIAEMIVFALILKEHKKIRAILYALAANFASLVLGGLLISYLPV